MKNLLLVFVIALFMNIDGLKAQTPAPPPKDTAATWFNIADSAAYMGKYKMEGVPFDYMDIMVKDGKLFYSGGGYEGNLNPIADKKDVFDAMGQAVFNFVRNAEGLVEAMKIDYNGMLIDGKREAPKK